MKYMAYSRTYVSLTTSQFVYATANRTELTSANPVQADANPCASAEIDVAFIQKLRNFACDSRNETRTTISSGSRSASTCRCRDGVRSLKVLGVIYASLILMLLLLSFDLFFRRFHSLD